MEKPSEVDELAAKYSPFIKEVRRRIIFTLIFFVITTSFGFIFYEKIIKILIGLLSLNGVNVVFTSPFQFISLAISCGIASGLVLSFPVLIFQILSFLRPALKEKEYKMIVRFLPFCLLLFLIGFAFGIIIMKWQIEIFLAKSLSLGIGNVLDVSRLLTVVLLTSALMGIAFQLPIVLLLLMRIGIVKREQLSKIRPWVYLGSFVFAVLLPPDSILADVFLSLPTIILFEITLVINKIFEGRKERDNNAK